MDFFKKSSWLQLTEHAICLAAVAYGSNYVINNYDKIFFKVLKKLPGADKIIEKEKGDTVEKMMEFIKSEEKNMNDPFEKLTKFPVEPFNTQTFVENMRELRSCEKDYKEAKGIHEKIFFFFFFFFFFLIILLF